LRTSKGGLTEAISGFREVNQALLRRHFKKAQGSSHAKAFAAGGFDAFTIIHEQQIRMEGNRKGDCGGFAFVQSADRFNQSADRINTLRFDYPKPNGRGGDPALDKRRRHRAGKFSLNGDRNNHALEHAGKQIDVPDQDEIIYGTGVGYDQLHKLEA